MSESPAVEELLAAQAARRQDPGTYTRAQARSQAGGAGVRAIKGRMDLLNKQLRSATRVKDKIIWLRRMADAFGEAVAPSAACKAGCDACCHQSVHITLQEAQLIARQTGVALVIPKASRTKQDLDRFTGQPCPFLQDHRCTIYAHRPMPCRTVYNMDADDLLCRMVPGHPASAHYFDNGAFVATYAQIHLPGKGATRQQQMESAAQLLVGDVRDFFPHGLQTPAPPDSSVP